MKRVGDLRVALHRRVDAEDEQLTLHLTTRTRLVRSALPRPSRELLTVCTILRVEAVCQAPPFELEATGAFATPDHVFEPFAHDSQPPGQAWEPAHGAAPGGRNHRALLVAPGRGECPRRCRLRLHSRPPRTTTPHSAHLVERSPGESLRSRVDNPVDSLGLIGALRAQIGLNPEAALGAGVVSRTATHPTLAVL